MASTVERYQYLVIRELGAIIEGPECNLKIERGSTFCVGGLVFISRTEGDAAVVVALARFGSSVVFHEVKTHYDAQLQIL